MSSLMEKFNEETNFEFDYIKLSSIDVFVRAKAVEATIIYPQSKQSFVLSAEKKITDIIKKILACNAAVNVKFVLSHFDADFFKPKLFAYFKNFPILNILCDSDVTVTEGEAFNCVTIELPKSIYQTVIEKKIIKDIQNFININYCEDIRAQFAESFDEEQSDSIDDFDYGMSTPTTVFENGDERSIRPENVEEFIGNIIYDTATYIEDAKKPIDSIVLMGTINQFEEKTRKKKEGETEEKKFYKFALMDFTGSVNCIYFPSKKTTEQIKLLKNGKVIVARGSLDADTFKNDGSVTYRIKDISLCTLPKNFTVNRIKRLVASSYKTVFPKPYVVTHQSDLFALSENKVPAYTMGKCFCVFDVETTGLSATLNKIIEIGGVKIINGHIVETFSSFVNPHEPIPERITELTGIRDSDVADSPDIEEVITDFYKFSDNAILIGHNVGFDYGFISSAGKPFNIYFDNDRLDTLALGKRYCLTARNYKLETLIKYYGIVNDSAHRAINDAIATAELFLKLAEKM